jgi:hypothetical protein
MELTSRLCRAQEAAQRERAASTPLENVRLVAERAATAWRPAALEAEQREARRARTPAIAEIAFLQRQRTNEDDQVFSENPDRGRAQI